MKAIIQAADSTESREQTPEQLASARKSVRSVLPEITPERWKGKFTTEEEDWEPVRPELAE